MISEGKHLAKSTDNLVFPLPVAPITNTTFSFGLIIWLCPLEGTFFRGCVGLHITLDIVMLIEQKGQKLNELSVRKL